MAVIRLRRNKSPIISPNKYARSNLSSTKSQQPYFQLSHLGIPGADIRPEEKIDHEALELESKSRIWLDWRGIHSAYMSTEKLNH